MNKYEELSIDQAISEIKHFEYHKEQKVQFSYLGAFDELNLMIINKYIDFAQGLYMSKQRTNLFRIFVELSQNINENSTLRKQVGDKIIGCGKLIIVEYDDYFIMVSSNPASKKDIETIEKRCAEINSKNKDELREMKRRHIRQQDHKEGNGDIGLIQIALMSENKLDLKTKYTDNSKNEGYISISVKINK